MYNGLTGCEKVQIGSEITNDQESVISYTVDDCNLLLECLEEKLDSQQRRIVELMRQCRETELK